LTAPFGAPPANPSAGPLLIWARIIGHMFRLTREVRFAVNDVPDDQLSGKPSNSYGGFPSLRGLGLGRWFALRVTVSGKPEPKSQYLVNIKRIDALVRERVIPLMQERVKTTAQAVRPAALVVESFGVLRPELPGVSLDEITLMLGPFLSYGCRSTELPMVRLSQKFEFSATHRLHNPALSEEENCRTYGKCNNPHGHGHNYEVQVTLRGDPNASGLLVDVPAFERIVASTVIDRFDHKNLNVEVPEFREGLIPSVENIAMTIYRLLKPRFKEAGAQLAAVTVWETPKTWCEYAE
jgi:6-pyruvoyltetrahydropterin/6-carboxytetrahydropterin synthase